MIDLKRHVVSPWHHQPEGLDIDRVLDQVRLAERLEDKVRGFLIVAFAAGAGRPDFALECVDEAQRLLPAAADHEAAQLMMAQAYCLSHKRNIEEMSRKLEQARPLIDRLTEHPWKVYFHHLDAVAALHGNRFAKALEATKYVLANSYSSDLQPLRGRALAIIGTVAGEFGMYPEAIKLFERARCAAVVNATTSAPGVLSTNNIAWTHCLFAEDLLSRGLTEKAFAVAAKAVELGRRAVEWAQTHKALREEINAVETLVAALILSREFAEARGQLDRLDRLVGREQASGCAIVTRGVVSRARLRLEDGDHAGAIALLEPEYVALDGNMARLHRSLLATLERAYQRAGRFEQAYAVSLQARAVLHHSLRGESEAMLEAFLRNISSAHHDWLAYIAHDLRSPVSNIVSIADDRSDDAGQPPKLEQIGDLARVALSSLGRYLDFARLDLGTGDFKPLQLNELVEQAVDFAHLALADKRLRLDYRPAAFVVVDGDWDLLHRAVTNILENAMAAAPEGTELVVEVDRWNDTCVLSISNDGEGIEPNRIASLFDANFQPSGTRKNFGLPITAFIIESHSGSFSVQSRSDRSGVCAKVVLPTIVESADT